MACGALDLGSIPGEGTMKKTKQIIKVVILSIVIIGLVATYLLAGLAPAPRREEAPAEEYVDYEELSSEIEETKEAQTGKDAEDAEVQFTGPPTGSVPHTNGPSSLPF